MSDLTGVQIGRYRLLDRIGSGAMASIYRAQDEELDRSVAIKMLAADHVADDESKTRLMREARLLAAINHPNIAAIYEVGEFQRRPYLAIEIVPGDTLSALLAVKPMGIGHALVIGAQIASALGAAHKAGVLHRDLKPENVIVGERLHVKVLDFSLGKWLPHSGRGGSGPGTAPGALVGSPLYMAPEQVRNRPLDGRADLFALGLILFEMAIGRTPYTGLAFADLMRAIVTERPPMLRTLRSDVPPELESIVSRLLEKKPEDRFETAEDVATMLEWISSRAHPTLPTSASSRSAAWKLPFLSSIARKFFLRS